MERFLAAVIETVCDLLVALVSDNTTSTTTKASMPVARCPLCPKGLASDQDHVHGAVTVAVSDWPNPGVLVYPTAMATSGDA